MLTVTSNLGETIVAGSRIPQVPRSDLTWKSLTKPTKAAIVDEAGNVYIRVLKTDALPPFPPDAEASGRAISDYIILRLVAALTADSSKAELFVRPDYDVRKEPDPGELSANPAHGDGSYDQAELLRAAVRRIHSEASKARHGVMLELHTDTVPSSAPAVGGLPDFKSIEIDQLGPIKEQKDRVPYILDSVLRLFPGLSAEDVEITPECVVRAPLYGFKSMIPDDLSRGEQFDRLEFIIKWFQESFGKDHVVTIGDRPDPFAGWIEIAFQDRNHANNRDQE